MQHKKPLPGILVILLDLLGIGAALGIFYLFTFVIQPGDHQPLKSIMATVTQSPTPTPAQATPAATATLVVNTPTPPPSRR